MQGRVLNAIDRTWGESTCVGYGRGIRNDGRDILRQLREWELVTENRGVPSPAYARDVTDLAKLYPMVRFCGELSTLSIPSLSI